MSNLIFEVCGTKCEINNVDLDKYSYIVFIKGNETMYAHEDKKVQLYLCKNIKAKMPNEVDKYIIDSDENMCYVFEQYTKVEVENIKMFVDFIPLDIVNSIATLLSTNTQPDAQTSKHTTQPSQSTNLSEGFDENEP